jgi:TonB family protein
MRPHLSEARHCYEPELANHAGLKGSVRVRFTIDARGQVLTSALESSSLGDGLVEACLLDLMKTCTFPKPLGGGHVALAYTFDFAPGFQAHTP